MKRVATFVCVLALFAIPTASAGASASRIVHSGSSATAKSGATLYSANFAKKRLKGWTVLNGLDRSVSNDGIVTLGGNGSLLAPYQARGVHDYSVRAAIRFVGANSQLAGSGLIVRGQGSQGVFGGTFSDPANLTLSFPTLFWNTDQIQAGAVSPHSGYNTYRLDAHGPDFSVFLNGQRLLQFTISEYGDAHTYAQVGLWNSGTGVIQVKSFTVTRLGRAPRLPAVPPVKKDSLTSSDVPQGLSEVVGAYYMPALIGFLPAGDVEKIDANGLILGYLADFNAPKLPASGPDFAVSYVYAYDSPQDAQAALTSDFAYFHDGWSLPQASNYAASDLTGLGDEAHAFTLDFVDNFYGSRTPTSLIGICFRRGAYEVNLFEQFAKPAPSRSDMMTAATGLAKIVDGRIQANG
jgi:hypothetical protein